MTRVLDWLVVPTGWTGRDRVLKRAVACVFVVTAKGEYPERFQAAAFGRDGRSGSESFETSASAIDWADARAEEFLAWEVEVALLRERDIP